MNTYNATVIKTGNSIALRVPIQYANDAKILPGDKVRLNLPIKVKKQNHTKIKQLFTKLQEIKAFKSIVNPTQWQKDIRTDRNLLKNK